MTIRAPSPTSTDELDTSSAQRTRPVVADRLCGARNKTRQNLPLRDQGCVLVSDRELLDQQPDAGPIRRRRPPDGRRRTWQRGFLHSAFRSRFGTSNQQFIPCLAARDLVGSMGRDGAAGTMRPCSRSLRWCRRTCSTTVVLGRPGPAEDHSGDLDQANVSPMSTASLAGSLPRGLRRNHRKGCSRSSTLKLT